MTIRTQINLEGWQDYRSNQNGAILFTETSHHSLVPVRDQLNENGNGVFLDPNYETGTVGLFAYKNTKEINKAIAAKSRYLFFGTRYEGANADFKNKYLIYGYQRIDKIKDVRGLFLNKFLNDPEPTFITLDKCLATWGLMRFVSFEDAYHLTDDQLREWGYPGRAARPLRTIFKEEHAKILVNYFDSKPDQTDEYINTILEYGEDEE
ncbi:hypothetical protein AGMMS49938_00460 [Fibrobacterales bacterium]|nr:hypothetical protein AGMMS49938_00460 [Fibrobacterales bacterium]